MKKRKKKLKGLNPKEISLRAIEINTNQVLGVKPVVKPRRIFRKEDLYISR